LVWKADITNTFHRSYRNLGQEVRGRADAAMSQLVESEDPTKLGLRKVARWKGVYSYEIGRQFRILYTVRFDDQTIVFLDVGTHGVYR
jgi:addiction module RelE/StbE family toxin